MKSTQYLAREPDESGFIHYPESEHQAVSYTHLTLPTNREV